MTGSLIISLDCEGKWGMADDPAIVNDEKITLVGLRSAYELILRTFEKNGIAGTFAVVGLYVAGEQATRDFIRAQSESAVYSNWLRFPVTALESRRTSGWFFEDLPKWIASAGVHELASHGFSHLPFTSPGFSDAIAHLELSLMRGLASAEGWDIESMVFPRNLIAHSDLLKTYGIQRFRVARRQTTPHWLSRIAALVDEFNVLKMDEDQPGDARVVPAGHFLNWRSGARRLVPSSFTLARWRHILKCAEQSGGVAHLWTHPHNLITGRGQADLFVRAMQEAGRYVREGRLTSVTFRDLGRVDTNHG